MRRIQWGRVAAITAVFAVVGPFIGFLAALSWTIYSIPADEPAMRSLVVLSGFFTVIIAYIVGAPMGLLTGLAAALASHRMTSGVVWVVFVTALGALSAMLLYRLTAPGMDRNLVIACAALASLGCALATVAIRPRGSQPD